MNQEEYNLGGMAKPDNYLDMPTAIFPRDFRRSYPIAVRGEGVYLYDESGKRIAWQDEPTTNTGRKPVNLDPHLVVQLPKAGRSWVIPIIKPAPSGYSPMPAAVASRNSMMGGIVC